MAHRFSSAQLSSVGKNARLGFSCGWESTRGNALESLQGENASAAQVRDQNLSPSIDALLAVAKTRTAEEAGRATEEGGGDRQNSSDVVAMFHGIKRMTIQDKDTDTRSHNAKMLAI